MSAAASFLLGSGREADMRVLVAFGSKRGGTAEIARIIGDELARCGVANEVRAAGEVRDVSAYDAVIVGGALYAQIWHRDARRFVLRHAAALRALPVWFFSSGPLSAMPATPGIPPTQQVAGLMMRAGARGHVTFGGRLAPDATGFPASAMAKTHAGDWRDPRQIQAWTRDVAAGLTAVFAHAPAAPALAAPRGETPRRRLLAALRRETPRRQLLATPRGETPRRRLLAALRRGTPRRQLLAAPRGETPRRRLLAALCLSTAVAAIGGGLALMARSDGSLLRMPLSNLGSAPFRDFLVPGLLLCGVVGLANLVAGILALKRSPHTQPASLFAGGALVVWIVVQMLLLHAHHPLQVAYLLIGAAIVVESLPHPPARRAGRPRRLLPSAPGGVHVATLWLGAAVLAASTLGCQPMRARGGPVDGGRLHDGVYQGAAKHLDKAAVAVTVAGGRLTEVTLVAFDASSHGQPARDVVPGLIVARQSTKVDAVSGATEASNVIMNAAEDAVQKSYAASGR